MKNIEPCSLAVHFTEKLSHLDFFTSCFNAENRFFGFDIYDQKEKVMMWNFPNKKEMVDFIQPLKNEFSIVSDLMKSEQMEVPIFEIGVFNPKSKMLVLIN